MNHIHLSLVKKFIDNKLRLSYGQHEELLSLVYKSFLEIQLKFNKSVTVIDAGANTGLHSNKIKNIINQESKLLCFEPIPQLYKSLNERYLNTPNLFVYPYGLGSSERTERLYICEKNLAKSSLLPKHALDSKIKHNVFNKQEEIQIKKLDNFELERVDFIKIDVEGFEYEVIEGSKNIISKYKPLISTEIVWDIDRLLQKAFDLDYDIWSTLGFKIKDASDIKECIKINLIDFIWIQKSKHDIAMSIFKESQNKAKRILA